MAFSDANGGSLSARQREGVEGVVFSLVDLHSELRAQTAELSKLFDNQMDKFVCSMMQGLRSELQMVQIAVADGAADNSPKAKPTQSIAGGTRGLATKPQTAGIKVLSKTSTASVSSDWSDMVPEPSDVPYATAAAIPAPTTVSLHPEMGDDSADSSSYKDGRGLTKSSTNDEALVADEKQKLDPVIEAQEWEKGSAGSDDSLALFYHHRRGYMAGREMRADMRLSRLSNVPSMEEAEEKIFALTTTEWVQKMPKRTLRGMARLREIVLSTQFQSFIILVIVLNSVSLGIQTDATARTLEEPQTASFKVLERIFCLVFVTELIVRVSAFGATDFFFGSDWRWNWFDAIMVVMQTVEVILELVIEVSMTQHTGAWWQSMIAMRVLRVVRFARIIRVLRALRSITELRTIIVSILGTLRTLWWTLVLLFLVIFIIAVTLTQIVTYHCMNEQNPEGKEALQRYFGSLGMSVLVLFQCITNGIDWQDVLRPLMDHISPWMAVPVVVYIGFGVFALMNIVTGVFVESALESARREKERFLLHTVKNLFRCTDVDDSGDISWNEFQAQLNHPAMHLFFKTIDLDINEAEDLFHLIDINDSGSIDPEEFVNGCLRLQGPAKAIDLATFMHEYKRSTRQLKTHVRKVIFDIAKARKASPGRPVLI